MRALLFILILIVVAALIAVIEAIALVALIPLEREVPYVLSVDRQTGYIQRINPLGSAYRRNTRRDTGSQRGRDERG